MLSLLCLLTGRGSLCIAIVNVQLVPTIRTASSIEPSNVNQANNSFYQRQMYDDASLRVMSDCEASWG